MEIVRIAKYLLEDNKQKKSYLIIDFLLGIAKEIILALCLLIFAITFFLIIDMINLIIKYDSHINLYFISIIIASIIYFIIRKPFKNKFVVFKMNNEQAEDILYLYNHMTEIEQGENLLNILSIFVQDNLNQPITSFDLNQCPVYQTALTRIIQHQNIDKIKQIKFWLEEQLELNSLNLFSEEEIKLHIDNFIDNINQEEKIDIDKEKQRFINVVKYGIINSKLINK